MVTLEQVREAALAADISEVLHHDCAVCGYWVRYRILDGALYFDGKCDCVRWESPPRPRSWQEAADLINMQYHDAERLRLMRAFGLITE